MSPSQERRVENITAGVVLSSMFAFWAYGARAEETPPTPEQVTVRTLPRPAPEVTVSTRATVAEFEEIFGCDVQHDMRPDTTGQRWASPKERACAEQIAFVIGKNSYGWGRRQQRALVTLWTHESAWSANADNAHSSAYGIPQAMTSEMLHGPELEQEFGDGKFSYYKNPVSQIQWGLQYIHGKYGAPSAANNFWQSQCGSTYGCWY